MKHFVFLILCLSIETTLIKSVLKWANHHSHDPLSFICLWWSEAFHISSTSLCFGNPYTLRAPEWSLIHNADGGRQAFHVRGLKISFPTGTPAVWADASGRTRGGEERTVELFSESVTGSVFMYVIYYHQSALKRWKGFGSIQKSMLEKQNISQTAQI